MFPKGDGDNQNQDQNQQPTSVINDVSPAPSQTMVRPDVVAPAQPQAFSVNETAPGVSTQLEPSQNSGTAAGAFGGNASSVLGSQIPQTPPKKSFNKKIIFSLSAVALVLILGAGYVFGFYLPNKPENAYNTAFKRTNKAFNTIISNLTDKNQVSKLEKSEINGKAEGEAGGTKYSGELTSKNDKSRLDLQASVSVDSGESGKADVKLNVLSEQKEGSEFPDIYFKVAGLSEIGAFLPESLLSYDDAWVLIDSNYLKKTIDEYKDVLQGAAEDESATKADLHITAEDVNEVGAVLNAKISEYILTADQNKAVLKQKRFVGKEKTDDINTFHYEMYISKANFANFCKALGNDFYNTKAYKRISGDSENTINDNKQSAVEGCDDAANDINEDDTFDMWVDAKYKLIHKIQVATSDDKKSYVEFGQTYKGGDSVRLFMNGYEDEGKTKITGYTDINFKAMSSNSEYTVSADDGNFKLNLVTSTTDKDIVIDKPKEAKSFEEFMNSLYGGGSNVNDDPLYLQGLESEISQDLEFDVNRL